eukprot:10505-Chlamydomonas_euryale.AAC.4
MEKHNRRIAALHFAKLEMMGKAGDAVGACEAGCRHGRGRGWSRRSATCHTSPPRDVVEFGCRMWLAADLLCCTLDPSVRSDS